jgi:competence protein ComEC
MSPDRRTFGRIPLIWPAGGFLAGVLLGDWEITPWLWIALGGAALGLAVLLLKRGGTPGATAALTLVALAVGALREVRALESQARAAADPRFSAGAVLTVQGDLLDRLEETDPRTLRVRRVRARVALSDAPGHLSVSMDPGAPGRPGERVALTGAFRPPRPTGNPGGFDSLAWARHEGILGSLSVGGLEGARVLGPTPGLMGALRRCRERLHARLVARFPGKEGDLLDALLLGIREPLSQELADAFVETGTVHYLAISGTHILVVLGALSFLLHRTPLGLKTRSLLLILAALGYAGLVGFQAPVLRSALGASLALAAGLLGRPRNALNAVAATAAFIALADPGQVFLAGFQLSFLAATGILLMAGPLQAVFERRIPAATQPPLSWLRTYLSRALGISLAAWLTSLPLVALDFHLVTPVAVLANLLVFPLITLLMGVGALALLPWPWGGAALAGMTRAVAALLDAAVAALAGLPGGHVYLARFPLVLVMAATLWVGLLAWRLRRGAGTPVTGPRLSALGLALLAAALAWPVPGPAGPRVTVLDVHHGLCVVAQLSGGRTLLYDCGAYGDPAAGARAMAPALWGLGVRRIDTLVISHAHADHVNALPALARRFPIGRIVTSAAAIRAPSWASVEALRGAIPLLALSAGDHLRVGPGASAEILHPPPRLGTDPNNASVCLRLSLQGDRARISTWRTGQDVPLPLPGGRVRLLLTGDLENWGTALLLADDRDLGSEILLVPHHGGALPTLAALLKRTRPREAWSSAREGFASPATLAALAEAGATVRETWRDGAMTLSILPADPGKMGAP